MGRFSEIAIECVATHRLIMKVAAGITLTLSIAFIIGGAVLVAQNGGSWKPDYETFDEMSDRQR